MYTVVQIYNSYKHINKKESKNPKLYVFQYKDHLGNIRLSYADINNNGSIEPASEILEENNYYPFGLKHQGYNELANANRSEQAEKYQYNGKEFEDSFGLNIYEYGARGYDPAIGRFFNMDNYAESFLDMSPYQYAGNNPVFFIDKNGDHIYIYDGGNQYKFSDGKLYARGDKDAWVEHTPEAGSFLETIFNALQEVYALSDISGEGGGAGGFGQEFLNYFNNDNANVHIFDGSKFIVDGSEMDNSNYTEDGINFLIINTSKLHEYFSYKFRRHNSSLSQIIVHELGHSMLAINNIKRIHSIWVEGTDAKRSEVFATYVENIFLSERGLPTRNYYLSPMEHGMENALKSTLFIDFMTPSLYNRDALKSVRTLIYFKRSLQGVPNTEFLLNY